MNNTWSVANWEELGNHLKVSSKEVTAIKDIHQGDPTSAKLHLFTEWLQMDCDPTWERFISALKSSGYSDIAQDMANRFTPSILSSIIVFTACYAQSYLLLYVVSWMRVVI